MNYSSKEKTAPSATNTRDGIETEINANDFASNYTGREAEMSMGNQCNLTHEKYPNIAKLVAFVDEQDGTTQFAALLLVIAAGLMKEAPL